VYFYDGAHELAETECQALLASAHVGRLSLTVRALPVVVPVNYEYLGGSVILSMADGPPQRAIALGNVIALGVDTANLPEPFWAVLVIGRAHEITDPEERAEYLRLGLTPQAAHTGSEAHYLQLMPDIMTGHRAT